MSYRFNFFARPIDADYKVNWETFLIELCVGIICAIMALTGWNTGMALMAYPAAAVAVMCLGLVTYTLIRLLIDKLQSKSS